MFHIACIQQGSIPRSPPGARPTSIQDASDPQPKHGGGLGRDAIGYCSFILFFCAHCIVSCPLCFSVPQRRGLVPFSMYVPSLPSCPSYSASFFSSASSLLPGVGGQSPGHPGRTPASATNQFGVRILGALAPNSKASPREHSFSSFPLGRRGALGQCGFHLEALAGRMHLHEERMLEASCPPPSESGSQTLLTTLISSTLPEAQRH